MSAIAVAILVAACSAAGVASPASRRRRRLLVLANNDSDLTGAPAVQKFVDRVAELSRGTVTVKVVSSWKGGGGEW
jgi:TRAP-type C4-dicarboxylate transport system substrate-binding protein